MLLYIIIINKQVNKISHVIIFFRYILYRIFEYINEDIRMMQLSRSGCPYDNNDAVMHIDYDNFLT